MPSQPDAAARRFAQLTAELEAIRAAEGLPVEESPPTTTAALSAGGPGAVRRSVAEGADREAAPVTLPGRHASRRFSGLIPEGFRGRIGIGPAQIAVISVVVAVGVAVTAWWLVRANGEEIDPLPVSTSLSSLPATPAAGQAAGAAVPPAPGGAAASTEPGATSAGGAATGGAATGGAATGGEIVVDVAGKVRRPGIVVLPEGSRVVDAVDQAGGPRRGISLRALNLARLLIDGEQILVGIRPVPGLAASAASAPNASAAAPGGLVNINTADAAQLEELPEVGPVTAGAIIAWRTENGGFTAVEELLDVDGIGEITLAKIAPHVTL